MTRTPGTFLSRLLAFCTLLCMAATLNAGFSSAQNSLLNLQHQLSGDVKVADGGWEACADEADDCDGHLAPVETHDDGIGLHHHHHSTEVPSGPLPANDDLPAASLASMIVLRPEPTAVLAGRIPTTLDQPPRL